MARCLAGRYTCVFSDSDKPRRTVYKPRKPRNIGGSVEQSLPVIGEQERNVETAKGRPFIESGDSSEGINNFKRLHHGAFERLLPYKLSSTGSTSVYSEISGPTTISRSGLGNIRTDTDPVQRLSLRDIEQYVSRYESLQHRFPFVVLPRQWTIQKMKEEHPFLLIGILSAMTVHETHVNPRLHAEFLRVLSERTILQGEKSLDILQGILVQVAW
jgi:hypothetical protein